MQVHIVDVCDACLPIMACLHIGCTKKRIGPSAKVVLHAHFGESVCHLYVVGARAARLGSSQSSFRRCCRSHSSLRGPVPCLDSWSWFHNGMRMVILTPTPYIQGSAGQSRSLVPRRGRVRIHPPEGDDTRAGVRVLRRLVDGREVPHRERGGSRAGGDRALPGGGWD